MTDPLHGALVAILTASGEPAGMGFVVGSGAVLTAAHVVRDALTGVIEDAVLAAESTWSAGSDTAPVLHLAFPLLPGRPEADARLIRYLPPAGAQPGDVAGLLLGDGAPAEIRSLRLIASGDLWHRPFRAFGLPSDRRFGAWVSGHVLGFDAAGRLQVEGDSQREYHVSAGFSGTPLWDDEYSGVIGMVVAGIADGGSRTSYAFPPAALLRMWPDLERFARPPSPYRGLASFGEADATVFHGREEQVEEVLDRIRTARVLPVIGESGVGKSSLLFAGVVPRLRAGGTAVAVLPPHGGTAERMLARALLPLLEPDLSPVQALDRVTVLAATLDETGAADAVRAALLATQSEDITLVADQAETLIAGELEQAQKLLRILGHLCKLRGADGRHLFRFVPVVRLDSMSRLEIEAVALDAWGAAYVVPTVNRDQIRRVIEGPLATYPDVRFEDGLVDRLVADSIRGQQPLPLLEFALTELWSRERGGFLRHSDYDAIGGVGGALIRYAEEVWTSRVQDSERTAARRLILRLVRLAPTGELYRDAAPLGGLPEPEADIARRLATTRVFSISATGSDDATVMLAHESLTVYWEPLRTWIEEDREFLTWRGGLDRDIERWNGRDRGDRHLLRADDVVEALRWSRERGDDLSATQTEFIDRSARVLRKRVRRWTALASVIVLTIAAGFVAGIFGYRRAAAIANQRLSTATAAYVSNHLGSLTADTAGLLAASAYRTSPTNEATQALLDGYMRLARYDRIIADGVAGTGTVADEALTHVAVVTASGLEVIPMGPNGPDLPHVWHIAQATRGSFNPGGSLLATMSADGHIQVWDTASRTVEADMDGVAGSTNLAWNPAGTTIATDGANFTARILDVATGHIVATASPQLAYLPWDLAYSPLTGDLIAVATDGNLFAWNPADGRQVAGPLPHKRHLVPSARGSYAATCDANGHWILTDPVSGHADGAASGRLECDGAGSVLDWLSSTLAVTSNPAVVKTTKTDSIFGDTTRLAKVLRVSDGAVLGWLAVGFDVGFVVGVRTDASGVKAVVEDGDGLPNEYHSIAALAHVAPPVQATTSECADGAAVTSPDGRLTAKADLNSSRPTLQITVTATGANLWTLELASELGNIDPEVYLKESMFAPDGTLITETGDVFERWDMKTGHRLGGALAPGGRQAPTNLPFTVLAGAGPPRIVLPAADPSWLEVWDVQSGRLVQRLGPLPAPETSIIADPAGPGLAVIDQKGWLDVGSATGGAFRRVLPIAGTDPHGAQAYLVNGTPAVAVSGDQIWIYEASAKELTLSPPPGTGWMQTVVTSDGAAMVLNTSFRGDTSGSPTSIPVELPPDPRAWLSAICQKTGRGLTTSEKDATGLSITNEGCG